jgi:GT2 family glycosyltransferase
MKSFSIIIITYKRHNLLLRCLQSLQSSLPDPQAEIVVVVNGNDSESSLLIKNSFPKIKLIEISSTYPGVARNLATKEVKSDFFFFLDDDTILPFDYFDKIDEIFKKNEDLQIFGGPDANYPNSTPWERALSVALTSPLATATTRYRHKGINTGKNHNNEEKLILCNMWVKSSIFQEGLVFDKRFFRNEENVFLHQAKEKGIKIDYFPNLYVHHKRKSKIITLFRAVMLSGSGRLRSFFLFPKSFNPIYFVPFFFCTYVISLIIFETTFLYKVPFATYLILNLYTSWKVAKNKRNSLFILRVSFIQFLINFSYGIGFYMEVFRALTTIGRRR